MMIDGHPYLTRLNTFISPEEMNKDPFFFESRDLTDVLERAHRGPPHDVRQHGVHGVQRPDAARADGRADGLGARGLEGDDLPGRRSPAWPGSRACRPPRSPGNARRPARACASSTTRAAIAAGIAANNDKFPNEQARFPIPSGAGGTTGVGGTVGVGSWGGSGGTGGGSGAAGIDGGSVGSGGSVQGTAGIGPKPTVGTGGSSDGLNQRSSGGGCGCATGGVDARTGVAAIAFAGVFGLSLARRRRRRGR